MNRRRFIPGATAASGAALLRLSGIGAEHQAARQGANRILVLGGGLSYGRGEATYTFYSLKHTALSESRAAHLSEGELMDLSGHKTRSAFEHYAFEDTESRRATLRVRDQYLKGLADNQPANTDKAAEFPSKSKASRGFDSHTLPPNRPAPA